MPTTKIPNTIQKLITLYPSGIKKTYSYSYRHRSKKNQWAPKLSNEEITWILNMSNRDSAMFNELVSADKGFQVLMKEKEKELLTNWFTKLKVADRERETKKRADALRIERKQRDEAERKRSAELAQKRKVEMQLQLQEQRKARKIAEAKKKEAEKAKIVKEAQKRLKMLKQLELSPKQELLLNKLLG